ncbi:hypothetical protein E3N88_19576 [Mikania micrantha]|uniref:Uncharacterized protein n=1 Tax=Mikania micrantha TaxID=192012 RepID=A0A5N6NQ91_9ASTR|nr:hypothetical protein E3N88_19576 [Mikania micrantha]
MDDVQGGRERCFVVAWRDMGRGGILPRGCCPVLWELWRLVKIGSGPRGWGLPRGGLMLVVGDMRSTATTTRKMGGAATSTPAAAASTSATFTAREI